MQDMVIDLSHWNPSDGSAIDWDKVLASGIVGVIHKATEGSSYVDDTCFERANDARDAGLLWGAYHFLRPGNMSQQAEHFVSTVGDIDLYAADHEDSGVSLDDLKDFLKAVDDLTGKTCVVYSGHVIKEQVGSSSDPFLADHPLWLAQYSSSPSWPKAIWPKWWIWQHTDQGSCPGIKGATDLNYYDGSPDELAADWMGEEVPPPAPEVAEVTIKITSSGPVTVKVVTE